MAGLRERQKEARRTAILRTAKALFNRRGYTAVSIEEIAARAELSVGTVYNYFRTKAEILFTMSMLELDALRGRQQKIAGDSRLSTAKAFNRMHRLFFEWVNREHRSLGRAISYLEISLVGKEQALMAETFQEPIREILVSHQRRGLLRPNIDLSVTTRIIYNLGNSEYQRFMTDERRTVNETLRSLNAQMDEVLSLWTA